LFIIIAALIIACVITLFISLRIELDGNRHQCTAYSLVSASLELSSCTDDHSLVLIIAAKSKI